MKPLFRSGPPDVGVIGAGLMGTWHARYARLCGASICGIADVQPKKAALLAQKFKRAISAVDLQQLLHTCDPEVIHICTPTASHESLVEQALNRGISFSILISFSSRPTECSMLIRSAQGTIHHNLFHDFVFCEKGSVSKLNKILHPFQYSALKAAMAGTNLVRRTMRREFAYPGLKSLIQHAYTAIRDESPPPLSYADIIQVARTRDRILALL